MFKMAFHTRYVRSPIMRLMKEQLDGACNDVRFDDDFFVELIFEAIVPGVNDCPLGSSDRT